MTYSVAPVTYSVTLPDGSKKSICTSRVISCAIYFKDGSVAFCHDYNAAIEKMRVEKSRRGTGVVLQLADDVRPTKPLPHEKI